MKQEELFKEDIRKFNSNWGLMVTISNTNKGDDVDGSERS